MRVPEGFSPEVYIDAVRVIAERFDDIPYAEPVGMDNIAQLGVVTVGRMLAKKKGANDNNNPFSVNNLKRDIAEEVSDRLLEGKDAMGFAEGMLEALSSTIGKNGDSRQVLHKSNGIYGVSSQYQMD